MYGSIIHVRDNGKITHNNTGICYHLEHVECDIDRNHGNHRTHDRTQLYVKKASFLGWVWSLIPHNVLMQICHVVTCFLFFLIAAGFTAAFVVKNGKSLVIFSTELIFNNQMFYMKQEVQVT